MRHPTIFNAIIPSLQRVIAYEMRNALAHGYFLVDVAIVWKTIHIDLPGMADQIYLQEKMQAEEG